VRNVAYDTTSDCLALIYPCPPVIDRCAHTISKPEQKGQRCAFKIAPTSAFCGATELYAARAFVQVRP
jgi:hypothetical protein